MRGMLACPVCLAPNHHLAISCSACGSFIQQKIENLDLFSVAWKLFESPSAAFKRITLAIHKNFVLLLNAASGIVLSFYIARTISAGARFESLPVILALTILLGPLLGLVFVLLFTTVVKPVLFPRTATWRNLHAIISYSLIPLNLLLVTSIPINIITFGMLLFTPEISLRGINPLSWYLLAGIDAASVLTAAAFFVTGVKQLLASTWLTAVTRGTIGVIVFAAMYAGAALSAGMILR